MKRTLILLVLLALFIAPVFAQCQGGGCQTCGTCSDNAFRVMDGVFRSCIAPDGSNYGACHQQAVQAACAACIQQCSPCQVCLVICGL